LDFQDSVYSLILIAANVKGMPGGKWGQKDNEAVKQQE
jgi:hypothetical protein